MAPLSLRDKAAGLTACLAAAALLAWGGMDALSAEPPAAEKVQPPAVAGMFYPLAAAELSAALDKYLGAASSVSLPGDLRALIVPHAGYQYSGPVAAFGYKALPTGLKRVIIIASNHNPHAPAFKFALPGVSHFATPLGKVPVSPVARELEGVKGFKTVPEAFQSHVVEVQLPFLQKRLSGFEIIPIVTGDVSAADLDEAAEVLTSRLDAETLLLVSSDLSHYHPYEEAKKLDQSCSGAVAAGRLEGAERCEACGKPGIEILLRLAGAKGWKGQVLDYRNSGDTAGEKNRVVGYASIAFYQEELGAADEQALLKLSRRVLDDFVSQGKRSAPVPTEFSEHALRKAACFVTLKKNGALRGCIGSLAAQEPLPECVVENTINAAVHDGRFPAVRPAELSDIQIEVSMLTAPLPYRKSSPEDLLNFLVPLKHGVILSNGAYQATFLPQVWEQLPQKEVFLEHLCRKGGMSPACWKEPETRIFTYEAVAFEEEGSPRHR